jgi:hypothetical protein
MRRAGLAGLCALAVSVTSAAFAQDIQVTCPPGLSEEASAALKKAAVEVFGPILAAEGLGGAKLEIQRGALVVVAPLTSSVKTRFRLDQAKFIWSGDDTIYAGNEDYDAKQALISLNAKLLMARGQVGIKVMAFHLNSLFEAEPLLALDAASGRITLKFGEQGPKPTGVRRDKAIFHSSDEGFEKAFRDVAAQVKISTPAKSAAATPGRTKNAASGKPIK